MSIKEKVIIDPLSYTHLKNSDYNFNGVDAPKNQTSYYGLRYATFVVPLVKAIQEQQEMIDKQQDEVSKLNIKIERRDLKG